MDFIYFFSYIYYYNILSHTLTYIHTHTYSGCNQLNRVQFKDVKKKMFFKALNVSTMIIREKCTCVYTCCHIGIDPHFTAVTCTYVRTHIHMYIEKSKSKDLIAHDAHVLLLHFCV